MHDESTHLHVPRSGCGRSLPRVCQISEYHCGPAVLQMLVARCGVDADQVRLTHLAQARTSISTRGVRVDELARAVRELNAGLCLWYKTRATPADLFAVVKRYRHPVGVEWQGFFEASEADEDYVAGEYGHYSVVTDIDLQRRLITLRDPYPDFSAEDRVFSLNWFVSRWWDVNLVPLPNSAVLLLVEDRHMLFVVTGERARFPAALDMRQA